MNIQQRIAEKLRDFYDDGYGCDLTWSTMTNQPGYKIKFHHTCGDGCCDWSNDYYLEPGNTYSGSKLWEELAPLLAICPNGEDYCDRSEQDDF